MARMLMLSGCLFFAGFALAQNLMTDDFNYPVRDSLDGLGGWFQSGLNTPNNVRVVSPGLTYAGYPGSGVGNAAFITSVPGDIVLKNFPTVSTGTVYLAMMLRIDSISVGDSIGYIAGFDQSGGPTNLNTRIYVRKVSATTFNLGIAKSASPVYAPSLCSIATTYLVVTEYGWVAGGITNDTSKIFIFSSGIPATEPAPAAFDVAGDDMVDNGQVFLCNSYAESPHAAPAARMDGIRIGTTWSGAVLTGVSANAGEAPVSFALDQNYPNPFNPATVIRFRVPGATHVRLEVFDLLGREVATLVNGELQAGEYQARFDAGSFGSGMYEYRMNAGNFVMTRKMVVTK